MIRQIPWIDSSDSQKYLWLAFIRNSFLIDLHSFFPSLSHSDSTFPTQVSNWFYAVPWKWSMRVLDVMCSTKALYFDRWVMHWFSITVSDNIVFSFCFAVLWADTHDTLLCFLPPVFDTCATPALRPGLLTHHMSWKWKLKESSNKFTHDAQLWDLLPGLWKQLYNVLCGFGAAFLNWKNNPDGAWSGLIKDSQTLKLHSGRCSIQGFRPKVRMSICRLL